MYVRLKQLVEQTLISKKVGLHTLRHSIATHLLQNGMTLEQISKFLGHGSMEATQIYTHILDERLRAIVGAAHPLNLGLLSGSNGLAQPN